MENMENVLVSIAEMDDRRLIAAYRASCLLHKKHGNGALKVHEAICAEVDRRGIDVHQNRGDTSFGMWEHPFGQAPGHE